MEKKESTEAWMKKVGLLDPMADDDVEIDPELFGSEDERAYDQFVNSKMNIKEKDWEYA